MDTEGIRTVVLRRNEGVGLGFSIMGGAGYEFPPVIYGIEKDSPAARSGLLEAGDIILAINEREAVKLTTKEVLKCLRLSGDIVNIKYKRDPHVVSRVRQFLSTPHYLNEQFPPPPILLNKSSSHTTGSSIPVPISAANNRSTVTTTTSSVLIGNNGVTGSVGLDNNFVEGAQPHHITFSDDLFINHTHNHHNNSATIIGVNSVSAKSTPKSPPTKSPSARNGNRNGKTNTGLLGNVTTTPGGIGRKNCETFVMTGDAILNLSKKDSNELCRVSPIKTTSKLTPLPRQSPASAPPHQIYSARIINPPLTPPPIQAPTSFSSENSSCDSTITPPLPPPPPPPGSSSNSTESSESQRTNVTVRSDQLPPPPPSLMMEEGQEEDVQPLLSAAAGFAQSQSNGQLMEMNNVAAVEVGKTGANKKSGKIHTGSNNNNNEDTSISSSVMSDNSGEELEEDDVVNCIPGEKDKNKVVLIVQAKKSEELERSEEEETRLAATGRLERERYNEYILLNGTAPVEEEDRSSGSAHAKGYEKMATPNDSEMEETGSEDDSPGTHHRLNSNESFSCADSDSSDVESMRIAPVTKSVDLPSAERLAKRLFGLDGFKSSDVWRQLSKNNDFSRAVAVEYLKYFEFRDETLDLSLRKFLAVCPLRGETQEREKVLTHFSDRYVECNPMIFASQDAVHTLACALMLLNVDMTGSGTGQRRMTCKDFIQNLSGLNDGGNFPEPILKKLYQAIKNEPFSSPVTGEDEDSTQDVLQVDPSSVSTNSKEFKRGYLKRKSVFESGGKKTPLGRRSWKMYFCRLRELVLVLSHDETKPTVQIQPINIHHSYASPASDYGKRPYVFRLVLADRSQFLFQSSDTREMNSWIDNINLNAARHSSPALEAPCGSSKRFERPLLPSSVSRMSARDQLITHQGQVVKWEEELDELNDSITSKRSNKKEFKERFTFYQYEVKRYRAYIDVLERHLKESANEPVDELIELQVLPNPPSVLGGIDESS